MKKRIKVALGTSVIKALCFAQNIPADFVKEIRQYMNHNHVIGYATLALKNLGYSQDEIWKVIHEMHSLFDFKSEEEAAEQAEDFLQERQ
ncbi:hypothetical protein [Kroppenstedtia eburnea]|uniref:RuvA, C-terminal domain n=1 Tax=Kroppenstedtia eburnea TaxID=714067 RepID=A0A1N7MFC2_9BACL|nr:hypothetical protein [Kroppenstedtia eburnea]QKI81534.1 hypothetical protein GXN75_05725 [Kroppenstedtia eburnea]SIS84681.1 RuvA, C-terminal domain [Kroppenstedtia eburnea]